MLEEISIDWCMKLAQQGPAMLIEHEGLNSLVRGGDTPCDPIQGAKSKLSMTDLDHITAMTIKNLHIDSCVYIYIYISVSGFHSTRTRFRGDAGDSREKAVGEMGRDSGIYSI